MEFSRKGFEQQRDSLTPAELDGPIDAYVPPTEEPSSESIPETEVVEPVAETEPEPEPEEPEEDKVPKSRLLTVLQRAKEAEESKAALEERIAALEQKKEAPAENDVDLPEEWIAMYGESEESKKFYKNHLQNLSQIEERAAERALEKMTSKAKEAEAMESEIATSLNTQFEELAEIEGKQFSEDDQVAILEIVEEYSPKDKDGKILREYMTPVSKAHEIWQLKKEAALVSKRQARSKVVSLTSAKTEGETAAGSAIEFIPGRRGQWETKLPATNH